MDHRFPRIRFADFTDAQPADDPPPRDRAQEVPRGLFDGNVAAVLARNQLALLGLWLRNAQPAPARSRAFVYPGDRAHGDLAPASPDHFRFPVAGMNDPVVPVADRVTICWRLKHTRRLDHGLLQLFVAGSTRAVWSKTLTAIELATAPPDVAVADAVPGTVFGGMAWDGALDVIAPRHQAAFPEGHLLASRSPYKLKLTVFTARNRILASRQAWTYFDVPPFRKYKLVTYVPSTNLGRFGLELDPLEPALKVLAGVYFVTFNQPAQWLQPPDQYKAQLEQDNEATWSDKFELRRAGGVNQSFRVALKVENRGTSLTERNESVLEDYGPEITRRAAAARAGLCVTLKAGRGQSHQAIRPQSRCANLVLFEPAFERTNPLNLSRDVTTNELAVLNDNLAVPFAAGPVAVTSQDPPTLAVTFAPLSAVLNGAAAPLLQLAQLVAERLPGITLPVYVTATGAAGPGIDLQRAQAVAAQLRLGLPLGHPVVEEAVAGAPQSVVVRIGYRDDAEKAALLATILPYCAAVHEFGHSLGLVDEYASYNQPGAVFYSAWPGQQQWAALCNADGFPLWPQPERQTADLMSLGGKIQRRYYLTLLEAVRAMVGAERDQVDAPWTIIDGGGGVALPPVQESPDFPPLTRCLEAAEVLIARGIVDVARLVAAIQAQTLVEGITAARLAYVKILDRATVQPVAGPDLAAGSHHLLALGVYRANTLLQATMYVNPRPVDPVVELLEIHRAVPNSIDREIYPRPDDNPRQAVLLRSSGPFEGTGTFHCDEDNALFFRRPVGGASVYSQLTAPGGLVLTAAELEQGVTLYSEGLTDQAQLTLQLASVTSLVAVAAKAVRARILAGAALRVHPFSTLLQEQPPALGQMAMNNPGVVVPLSPAWQPGLEGRCKVVVRQGPDPKVYLRVDPTLALYRERVGGRPASGRKRRQGVEYQEIKIKPRHFRGQPEMVFWLQGNQVSAAPRDCKIALTNPANAPLGACDVTVMALVDQVIRIPATPPLTARVFGGVPNQPQDQEYRVEVEAQRVGVDQALFGTSFEKNPPLVLIAGAAAAGRTVEIQAEIRPLWDRGPIAWSLERAADDDAQLRTAYNEPTPLEYISVANAPHGGGQVCRLRIPTDAVGSFNIRLKAAGSTLAITNYVGVKAEAIGPEAPTVAAVAHYTNQARAQLHGTLLMARTGVVPFPDPTANALGFLQANACAAHAGRVRLTGGGPQGKRGLDKVFAGWIQNKLAARLDGQYTDASAGLPGVVYAGNGGMVTNQAQASILPIPDPYTHQPMRDRFFTALTPAPVPLVPPSPLLDTGRTSNGGMTATLGSRHFVRNNAPAFGQEVLALAVDSPGTEFLSRHRSHGNALLTQASYEHTFRAYLCVWSDMAGRDDGNGPGDRLYAAVADFEWRLEGTWTVTWPALVHAMDDNGRLAAPNWWQQGVVAETLPFRAWISQAYAHYPRAVPAEGRLEVRGPTPLQVFGWDFR